MTRLNLVPPSELTDQHLFAEFREIKMVPKSLARSIAFKPLADVQKAIPDKYCLGKGHVSFFYNKRTYLELRYNELRYELRNRHINYNFASKLDPDRIFKKLPATWHLGYNPTDWDLNLIRLRIAERIAKQPEWYKYFGNPISELQETHPCVAYFYKHHNPSQT